MWGESGYEIKIGGFAATTFCTRQRQLVVRGADWWSVVWSKEWGESELIKLGFCRHILHRLRHAHIKTHAVTHTPPLSVVCARAHARPRTSEL